MKKGQIRLQLASVNPGWALHMIIGKHRFALKVGGFLECADLEADLNKILGLK